MASYQQKDQQAKIISVPTLKNIHDMEYIARLSHRSEEKISTNTEDMLKFFRKIIELKHFSVFEFCDVITEFYTSRAIANELVRHRLCSYMQECVVGDTELRKNLTIRQLYNRQHGNCYGRTHNKTINLRSIDENGNIIPNKFNEVFYKGVQPVYEVQTNLGYKIKCTKNHKFLKSNSSYATLSSLQVGSEIMVNGRPCLCSIEKSKLTKLYTEEQLSPIEISEGYGIPYRSVVSTLQKLGIFEGRKNDKNKEKYNKNHTIESRNKMRDTIRLQYKNGRRVWNKGLSEFDNKSVAKQADALRLHHHNNKEGIENSGWKGGPKNHNEARILKAHTKACELCGSCVRLEVHHKDKNRSNNNLNNLIKICCKCHNLLHHGWYVGTKAVKDTIVSIIYVGEEDVYDLEMKSPYNNYVANGFVVHNSTRYVNYKKFGEINLIRGDYSLETLSTLGQAVQAYYKILDDGGKPEDARDVLPLCLGTTIVVKTNLREWGYIFKMRHNNPKVHHRFKQLLSLMANQLQQTDPISLNLILNIAENV